MSLDEVSLLLHRPDDLIAVRVRLSGCTVVGDVLAVSAGGGRAEVTFPPQATGEAPYVVGTGPAPARRSGTSRLTFLLAAGTTGAFTADGLVDLLAGSALDPDPGTPAAEPISVELPWRIRFRLAPAAGGDALLNRVPRSAFPGAMGATGLWQLRVEAASGVALVPLDVDGDEDPGGVPGISVPLDRGLRERIVGEGSPPQPPPVAPYVDLGALGGTLEAHGAWPTFAWDHHTVLGRDLAIRTTSVGTLYPWGHRAERVRVATRELVDDGGGGVAAGLRQTDLLVVTDPVRRRASEGPLARALPFDAIEVLQPVTLTGPGQTLVTRQRVPFRLAEADAELASAEDESASLEQQILINIDALREAFVASRDAELGAIGAEIGGRATERDALAEIDRLFQEWAARQPVDVVDTRPPELIEEPPIGGEVLPPPPPLPPTDPPPPMLTVEQAARLNQLTVEIAGLEAQQAQRSMDWENAIASVDQEDDLATAGSPWSDPLPRAHELRDALPGLRSANEALHAEADQVHTVASWCTTLTGERLVLPLDLDGHRTSTPVLFVDDLRFDAGPDFPEFAPLRDADVLTAIADAWATEPARALPMSGALVDLVRSGPQPLPSDVLPLHELTVAGQVDTAGGFRAVVEEAKVALTAVEALVPRTEPAGQGPRPLTRVAFDPNFLREGLPAVPGLTPLPDLPGPDDHLPALPGFPAVPDVPVLTDEAREALTGQVALRLASEVPVDFRQAADRAGGLISPVFTPDVLSRVTGPADERALPSLAGGVPDLATVFAGATLLGIPLGRLLDLSGVPQPLTLVPTPDGGARMTWDDVALTSHGPFHVVAGRSRLQLTVVASPATTETTCRVDDFDLVLPPGGDLVRLHFGSLVYTQRPDRPPKLDVQGLTLRLGGDLDLLQTLEEVVDLGDQAPVVRATDSGLSAGYRLAVPSVTAGMFTLSDIAVSVGVDVPFDGRPIVTTLAFASPEHPFRLGVSVFAGTGYLVFEIAEEGIRRLDAALDFGAAVAIGIGVATAEVHALGGVRFALTGREVAVTGFLRVGGSVDVLGLVSVSVELRVELTYEAGVLAGRATAVIQVDVTFWSGSLEVDSGTYELAGAAAGPGALPPSLSTQSQEPSLADWQEYRARFQGAG